MAQAPKRTISEVAHERMRTDIISGELAPGEKLKLADLQKRYDLGLSPIREALLQLSGEGLVNNEGQRGFRVAPLSRADLDDLMSARIAIESMLFEDAIAHGDDNWGAAVTSAWYKLSKAPLPNSPSEHDGADYWEATHREFHRALLSAARSKWLLRINEQLVNHSERYRRIRLVHPLSQRQLAQDVISEHEAIMKAALSGQASKAVALLKLHLMRTTEVLAERFASDH